MGVPEDTAQVRLHNMAETLRHRAAVGAMAHADRVLMRDAAMVIDYFLKQEAEQGRPVPWDDGQFITVNL